METLDDILRYSAFGLLIWTAVLVMREFCDRLAGRLGAMSAIASAAYLLSSKPGLELFGIDLDLILLPVIVVSPVLTWLFCLSQFDDKFQINLVHKGVFALKFVTGIVGYLALKYGYVESASFHSPSTLIVVGITIHLAYVTWQGRNDDLVEDRRSMRSVFAVGVILISIGITVSEVWLRGAGIGQYLLVCQSVAFLSITLYLLWRISAPDGVDLFFTAASPTVEQNDHDHCELTPTDQHDLDIIVGLARSGVVLEQGLTIAKMAQDTRIPEHKLRHLINQHLGFRNFADFLNHHRIEMAKSRLSAHENRHVPVLTVAMDLGYGSLGPFNRAFKERTGQTPTEYRSQSMLEASLAAQ